MKKFLLSAALSLVVGACSMNGQNDELAQAKLKMGTLGGKTGTAIGVSALIDINGVTDVTVAKTSGGEITKLQIKAFSGTNNLSTNNMNNLNNEGSIFFQRSDLSHGQTISVQANLKSPGSKKTTVDRVTTTVKYLPDLVPTLSVQATADDEDSVSINVVVNELNGDVGASATCTLSIDGSQVDQANIVVSAGGASNCNFNHTFGLPLGERNISVNITNVDPRDYDPSNNSDDSVINITD